MTHASEKGHLCAGDLFRYTRITFLEPGSILDAYGYIRRDVTIHASLKTAVDPIRNRQYLTRAGEYSSLA
ncbi:hypothetical protein AC624_16655 [Bacillus sp. FJAT-27238]|nr:hypothetical protein AC624_16655 [Bacillus sp. FJAT-27238]